jgi:hypothetical protein
VIWLMIFDWIQDQVRNDTLRLWIPDQVRNDTLRLWIPDRVRNDVTSIILNGPASVILNLIQDP